MNESINQSSVSRTAHPPLNILPFIMLGQVLKDYEYECWNNFDNFMTL